MRKRTKAREYTLQLLYQIDITHSESRQTVEDFWNHHTVSSEVKAFAVRLVQGTLEHLRDIDQMIATYASNWEINRMAVVDRNILRLGAYELLYLDDIPPKVCLSEAVELAKRFGDEESGKFVNGILDAIHKAHVHRSDEPPGPHPSHSSVSPSP